MYFLDFGQAFPSLNQDFLQFLLGSMGLPPPRVDFARFLCSAIEGLVQMKGVFKRIYLAP
eukprot:8402801-Pyramimonas_sp.AAC.1